MKKIGIIIIAFGLLLGVMGIMKQRDENHILKIGNLELKKEDTQNINWLMKAGGLSVVLGVLILLYPKKT